MKMTFVLLISLVLSGSAFAGGPTHDQHQSSPSQQQGGQGQSTSVKDTSVNVNQNRSNSNSYSDSNSRSNSDSNSSSKATGGTSAVLGSGNSDNHNSATGGSSRSTSAGGAGGSSSVGNTTANGGSAQGGSAAGGSASAAVGDNVSNLNNYQQVRQASSAYAPDALPSAPCRVSGSVGASSPFGGLSAGGSKLDAECDRRETARAFALLGNKLAAARILCNTKAAKEAQLTFQECANYEEGYFGGVQDGDGPGFTVPAGKGTPKK